MRQWLCTCCFVNKSSGNVFLCSYVTDWWLVRVTLMVAFGFFPKMLRGGGDLRMILLLLYACNLNSVDNQRCLRHTNPTSNFLHSQVAGTQKLLPQFLASLLSRPTSHLVVFPLHYFLLKVPTLRDVIQQHDHLCALDCALENMSKLRNEYLDVDHIANTTYVCIMLSA